MDVVFLRQLYAYHHWATDRLLPPIARLDARLLDRPWSGSFGSGRALLRHVVGAEWLWLERWQGRSAPAVPPAPTGEATPFIDAWERIKEGQGAFLRSIEDDRLTTDLAYINLQGERWTFPLGDVLVHVVNHGTYHRGQMAHLLRDLGERPASTDYLLFIEERRGITAMPAE